MVQHTLGSDILSGHDHERAVLAVESWVIRRMLRGANTRGYGLAFLNVLKAAQRAERLGHDIADAVIEALDNDSRSLGWPDDAEIQQLFVEKPVYRDLSAERLRMVFGAIDEELQRRNHRDAAAVFDYERLQIEHIMPQKWGASWPLTAEMPLGAEQFRDNAVHTAGNLTLVTSTFNSSVSNGAWSAKRPEFANQSKLEINRGLGGITTWDEATIAQRAKALASVAIEVWRSPQALLSKGNGQTTADAAPAAPSPTQLVIESGTRSGPYMNAVDGHVQAPDTTQLPPLLRHDRGDDRNLPPGNNDRRWFSFGFSGTKPNSRNDMANAAYAVVVARPGQPQNTGLVFAAFDDESRALRFMATWAAKEHSCWLVTAHPDRGDLADEQREALIVSGGVLATALPNEPLVFHDPPQRWPGT